MIGYLSKRRKRNPRAGAATTEFALILPVVVLLILGSLELMTAFFINNAMEGGLRQAARYGLTGQDNQTTRQAQILSIVDDKTFGFVDMETASLTTKIYPSFAAIGEPEDYEDLNGNGQYDPGEPYEDDNGNGQWDDDAGIPGIGEANDIILYELVYDWPMLTGYLSGLIGEAIRLKASIAVRNEPFG